MKRPKNHHILNHLSVVNSKAEAAGAFGQPPGGSKFRVVMFPCLVFFGVPQQTWKDERMIILDSNFLLIKGAEARTHSGVDLSIHTQTRLRLLLPGSVGAILPGPWRHGGTVHKTGCQSATS